MVEEAVGLQMRLEVVVIWTCGWLELLEGLSQEQHLADCSTLLRRDSAV